MIIEDAAIVKLKIFIEVEAVSHVLNEDRDEIRLFLKVTFTYLFLYSGSESLRRTSACKPFFEISSDFSS